MSPMPKHARLGRDHTAEAIGRVDSEKGLINNKLDRVPPPEQRRVSPPVHDDLYRQLPTRTAGDLFRLSQCNHAVAQLARHCDQQSLAKAFCGISLLLNARRSMIRGELTPAVMLAMTADKRTVNRPMGLEQLQESDDEQWLKKAHNILRIDSTGVVTFTSSEMQGFFETFTLPGLDVSHSTMAFACAQQIELNEAQTASGRLRSCWKYRNSMFSRYANENLDYHVEELNAGEVYSPLEDLQDP